MKKFIVVFVAVAIVVIGLTSKFTYTYSSFLGSGYMCIESKSVIGTHCIPTYSYIVKKIL